MRFLVDANLPPAFARWLRSQGFQADHMAELGLAGETDRAIWEHARQLAACIVTKDGDFVLLHALDRAGPPVVWVRVGNAVRRVLLQRIPAAWPGVVAALRRGEKVVEVS